MLQGHGSDAYKYESKIVADFSSNVYYKGLPDGLEAHLQKKMPELVNYPEPDAGKLAKRIAHFHNIQADMVLPTNGASEAFYLLAQVFKNSKSTIVYPSFSEYEDACKVHQHELTFIHNSTIDFTERSDEFRVVWLGNPNNPDGKLLKADALAHWINNNPNTYFIVDEAYGELCHGFQSMVDYLGEFLNLIIVKSLTKAYGIAGLRLGYVLANPVSIDLLKLMKTPWSVNALAIEAGMFIMDHHQRLAPNVEIMYSESMHFQKAMATLNGVDVFASGTNYFLAKLQKGKAHELKHYLATKHGLLIRDASNFKGLSPQHFRLALQDNDNNLRLVEALANWLNNE